MKNLLLLSILILSIASVTSCSDNSGNMPIENSEIEINTKSNESIEKQYNELVKYLTIEDYRYKVNLSDEEIYNLDIEKSTVDRFLSDIKRLNDEISMQEKDPEILIEISLPGQDIVVVPTIVDGVRKDYTKQQLNTPMLAPISDRIE